MRHLQSDNERLSIVIDKRGNLSTKKFAWRFHVYDSQRNQRNVITMIIFLKTLHTRIINWGHNLIP